MVDQIRVVARQLQKFVARVVAKITLDIVANLERPGSSGGTPVDTGWARANWVPSIGSPGPSVPTPPTRKGRRRGAGSRAARQAAASTRLFGYKVRQGPVFISNGVPYIVNLNAGSSKQAPRNFVQANIRKALTVDIRRI